MSEPNKIHFSHIVIGQYADYLDTGLWMLTEGEFIAPEDVTVEQIKDMLLIYGGAVYLNKNRNLAWVRTE